MNKTFKSIVYSTVSVSVCCLSLMAEAVKAQEIAQANPGELPNNSQQMKSWQCVQGDSMIAVQAKDVNFWQPVIEGEGWKCLEGSVDIAGNDRQFSCEPDETIGILTVTWLKGKAGKQQMESWVEKIEKDQNLSCTVNESSQYLAP